MSWRIVYTGPSLKGILAAVEAAWGRQEALERLDDRVNQPSLAKYLPHIAN
ncbi:MAG: hypothetical protein P8163_06810 [Candidatus Thiodiazotropha sp.]